MPLLTGSSVPAQVRDDTPLAQADQRETITVTGRVTDASGNPIENADVLVLRSERSRSSRPLGLYLINGLPFQHSISDTAKTDRNGAYRVKVVPTLTGGIDLFAAADGYGMVNHRLEQNVLQTNIDLVLSDEHAVRGKLVDLSGVPVVGATVRVLLKVDANASGTRDVWRRTFNAWHPRGLRCWETVQTDEQGRFLLRGLSSEAIRIQVESPRTASFQTESVPLPIKDPKSTTISLSPAHSIHGTVVRGDTGKPAANARVISIGGVVLDDRWQEVTTDDQGRFVVNPFVRNPAMQGFGPPVDYLYVYPPDQSEYCVAEVEVGNLQAANREVKVTLQPGVLIEGFVRETDTGHGIAGARVQFCNDRKNDTVSRGGAESSRIHTTISEQDGKFLLRIPRENGHLLVLGPTLDYVDQEMTYGQLNGEGQSGRHVYADAIIPIVLQDTDNHVTKDIELQRGVTRSAEVIDAARNPVTSFLAVSSAYNPNGYEFTEPTTLYGREGRFALQGCRPDNETLVSVYDPKTHCGATESILPNADGSPVQIQLQPCGSATLRLVDADQKPVSNRAIQLQYVLREPGAADEKELAIHAFDADYGASVWLEPAHNYQTDEHGTLKFENLIPGLVYRIVGHAQRPGEPHTPKTFKVSSSQHLDLGSMEWPR